MLRREVKDVFSELPEKVVHPIYCQLPPLGVSKADTPLATLRQITGLAKVPFSAEFIRGILEDEPETKIVAFAYSRAVIEALADCPLLERFNPVFIYGGLTQADKQFALRHFKDDSRCRLIILQIKAAGEGIDGLQNVSNVVVFPELEWSAGTFDQAVARLDRIGQKSVVRIYPIIAKNTLDESIIGSYHKKSRTIRQLFDNTTEGSKHMAIEDELKTIAVSLKELCSIVSNVLGEAQKVADQKKTVADLDKQKETKAASKPATKPADKPKDNVVKMAEPSSKEEEMRALMLKVVRACPEGKDAGKKDIAAVLSACGVKPPKSDAVTADQQEAVIQGLEKKLMIYSAPPAEESDDLDAV
jgi:superfamily II DNA/RNA helicase